MSAPAAKKALAKEAIVASYPDAANWLLQAKRQGEIGAEKTGKIIAEGDQRRRA